MSQLCEQVHAFVDGELDDERASAFREHLGACERCQAELRDALFMANLELGLDASKLRRLSGHEGRASSDAEVDDESDERDEHREPKVRTELDSPPSAQQPDTQQPDVQQPDVQQPDVRTFWRRFGAPLALAAAAVAALVIWMARSSSERPGTPSRPVALATHLAPQRYIEGRLSHPQALAHRPLEQLRAGTSGFEPIPPTVAAGLYEARDLHGVATVELLGGNPARARATLGQVERSPAVESDLALTLLMAGQPEAALAVIEDVIEAHPEHGPAWWNRALSLRALELPMVAAEAFDEVAALNEPGWAEEARTRADHLRARVTDRRASYDRAVEMAASIVDGLREYDLELVAAHPGAFRRPLYLALGAADTPESVQGLAPLADALARVRGTDAPRALVARVAKSDFSTRQGAVSAFRELEAASYQVSAERLEQQLGRIRSAGAEDILLIAMYQTGGYRSRADEFERLVRAAGDPWFEDLRDYVRASGFMAEGKLTRAEGSLLAAVRRCAPPSRRALCPRLLALVAKSYARQSRVELMHRHAQQALSQARQDGDVPSENALLDIVGESVRLSMRLELSRAYRRESMLRDPAHSCVDDRAMGVGNAWGYLSEGDVARAVAAMAQVPETCPADGDRPTPGLDLQAANIHSDLAAATGDEAHVRAARRLLDRLRASPTATDGDRLKVAQLDGALLLLSEPERGREALEDVIARAERSDDVGTHASRARSLAFALLLSDATERGDHGAALALFAREARVGVLPGCAVAASLTPEERRIRGVVRGADGAVVGFTAVHDIRSPLRSDWIPEHALSSLRGCSMVDVIARPPLPLSGSLLPVTIPWRFRMGRTRPGGGKGASQPGRRLVVHSVDTPAGLGLARLQPWRRPAGHSQKDIELVELSGRAATPARVQTALADATEVEFHTHGLVDLSVSDASFLALAPGADGVFGLTAGAVEKLELRGRPIVTLGACHAGHSALYLHESWSLPLAFLKAGARLVIASQEPLPDGESTEFLAGVRGRIAAGEEPAQAVHLERVAWLNAGRGEWTRSVLVFE